MGAQARPPLRAVRKSAPATGARTGRNTDFGLRQAADQRVAGWTGLKQEGNLIASDPDQRDVNLDVYLRKRHALTDSGDARVSFTVRWTCAARHPAARTAFGTCSAGSGTAHGSTLATSSRCDRGTSTCTVSIRAAAFAELRCVKQQTAAG